ncbi:MAG: VWA domain-containing protein [Clostridiales Family XIII bacterium]|jgi:hypothetical protein|nr:VWA domain-containing protein [Clostridiales Family XIII bacterium]
MYNNIYRKARRSSIVFILILAMLLSLINYQFMMTTSQATDSMIPLTGDENPEQISLNDENWIYPDWNGIAGSDKGLLRMKETIRYVSNAGIRQENFFDVTVDIQTKEDVKEQTVPANGAVVISIDLSQTMYEENVTGKPAIPRDRIQQIQNSVTDYIRRYYTGDTGDFGKRMLSIVVYGEVAATLLPWTNINEEGELNRAIEAVNNDNLVKYQFQYTDKDGVVASGGTADTGLTNISGAMKLTDNLYTQLETKGIRFINPTGGQNKFAILFTDGIPTTRIDTVSGKNDNQERLDWQNKLGVPSTDESTTLIRPMKTVWSHVPTITPPPANPMDSYWSLIGYRDGMGWDIDIDKIGLNLPGFVNEPAGYGNALVANHQVTLMGVLYEPAKDWPNCLGQFIDNDKLFSANNQVELDAAFEAFTRMTRISAMPWDVILPLADPVFPVDTDGYNAVLNQYEWNLSALPTPEPQPEPGDDGFVYHYTHTYRIYLDTLSTKFDGQMEQIFKDVNRDAINSGNTYEATLKGSDKAAGLCSYLDYAIKTTDAEGHVTFNASTGYFEVPKIYGYDADLQLVKKDVSTFATNQDMNGFRFIATSSGTALTTNQPRRYDAISANQEISLSNGSKKRLSGLVIFTDGNNGMENHVGDIPQNALPSGQNYILSEDLSYGDKNLQWTPSGTDAIAANAVPVRVNWGLVSSSDDVFLFDRVDDTENLYPHFGNVHKLGSLRVVKELNEDAAQWGATGTSPYAIAVRRTDGRYLKFEKKDHTTYVFTGSSITTETDQSKAATYMITSDAPIQFINIPTEMQIVVEEVTTGSNFTSSVDYMGAGADGAGGFITIKEDAAQVDQPSTATITNTYAAAKGTLTVAKTLGVNPEYWGIGDDTTFAAIIRVTGGGVDSGKYLKLKSTETDDIYAYDGLGNTAYHPDMTSKVQMSVNNAATVIGIPMDTKLEVQEVGINGRNYMFTPTYSYPDGDNTFADIEADIIDSDGDTVTIHNDFDVPFGSLDIVKTFAAGSNHAARGVTDQTPFTATLTTDSPQKNVVLQATADGYTYVGTTTGAATPVTFSVASKASITKIPSGTSITVQESENPAYHTSYAPSNAMVNIHYNAVTTVTAINTYDANGTIRVTKTGAGAVGTQLCLLSGQELIANVTVSAANASSSIELAKGLQYGDYTLYEVTGKEFHPSNQGWILVEDSKVPDAISYNAQTQSVYKHITDIKFSAGGALFATAHMMIANEPISGNLQIMKVQSGSAIERGIAADTTYGAVLMVDKTYAILAADEDGNYTWTDTTTTPTEATKIILSAVQDVTIKKIPAGTVVHVAEDAGEHYQASYSTDDVEIIADETVDITVTNVYDAIQIGVEVDKDTINETTIAFQSREGDEDFDNIATQENYRYEIDFRNTSNLDLDEFVYDDPLEAVRAGAIDVYALYTPIVWGDVDGHFNVWYKTNKTDDLTNYATSDRQNNTSGAYPNTGYKLWAGKLNANTTERHLLTVKDLGLPAGEYLTGIRLEYGTVLEGFTTKNNADISQQDDVYVDANGNLDRDKLGEANVSQIETFNTDSSSVKTFAVVPNDGQETTKIVDWTPATDRVDADGNHLSDAALEPAAYFVTARKASQGEDLVASAYARGAARDHATEKYRKAQALDVAVTATIETFATQPSMPAPESPTVIESVGELDPLPNVTSSERVIQPEPTPSQTAPPVARAASRTGDDMDIIYWILTGILSLACVGIMTYISIVHRMREV